MPSIMGLITARGGSKGIPGKNIKILAGKPLIAWTIEAAQTAAVFDRVILSSDDREIQGVAQSFGCDVPFTRPAELANDTAGHLAVAQHAIEWLHTHQQYEPEYVMLLQPTSPARQAFHIREAAELAIRNPEADSVLSVSRVPESFNSQKTMRIEDGCLRLVHGGPVYKRVARRQDLHPEYYSAGLVYLFKTALLTSENPNLYGEKTIPYEIDPLYAVDIDTPEDWLVAERVMGEIKLQQQSLKHSSGSVRSSKS